MTAPLAGTEQSWGGHWGVTGPTDKPAPSATDVYVRVFVRVRVR